MEDFEYLKKYVEPYIWIGQLTVDDGWGPHAASTLLLCTDSQLFGRLNDDTPFTGRIASDSAVVPTSYTDPVTNLTVAQNTQTQVNKRFEIAFLGHRLHTILDLITMLDAMVSVDQRWVLHAYENIDNEKGAALPYRLVIYKHKGKPATFKVLKGTMQPFFDTVLPIASWSDNNIN